MLLAQCVFRTKCPNFAQNLILMKLKYFTALLFSVFIFQNCIPKEEIPDIKEEGNYITRIFEYVYAPGQHASLALPADTVYFKGNPSLHSKWVYLGGFGGYITGAFERNVINGEGADFEVFALRGSSPEPAIVYVMQDENGDGFPNETWYELKGSQNDSTLRNYWVRYYKPEADSANVRWRDSLGETGELLSAYGAGNSAKWWWASITTDSITFNASRLPDAYINQSTAQVQLWTVPRDRFQWGYAENIYGTDFDNVKGSNRLDISNAVDSLGNAVSQPEIRFIKVQTAVFQRAGWTNEVSAEVRGAGEIQPLAH